MRDCLLLSALLPLLFLSGCDSDDPTAGISVGTQVIYGIKTDENVIVKGIPKSEWITDITEHTVSFRDSRDYADDTYAKSDIAWIEAAKTQKPMPPLRQ